MDVDEFVDLHSDAVQKDDSKHPDVEAGNYWSYTHSCVDYRDVADGYASNHGAERRDHQRPGRPALNERKLLRAQKVHNEGLQGNARSMLHAYNVRMNADRRQPAVKC